jgi:hypothetical protein
MTTAIITSAPARRFAASDALLATLGFLAGSWTTIVTRARSLKSIPAHVWLASYLITVAVMVVTVYTAIRLHNLLPGPMSVSAIKAEYPAELQPYIKIMPAVETDTDTGAEGR